MLHRFVAFFGKLYKYASYFGNVDIGIAFTGLKDSKGFTERYFDYRFAYQCTEDTYKTILRFPATLLEENPREVAAKFNNAFYRSHYIKENIIHLLLNEFKNKNLCTII